jgi:hypothetical protein
MRYFTDLALLKNTVGQAKCMWMGGNVPLGYDVRERKLVVSEAEASTVRMIFQRYADAAELALSGQRRAQKKIYPGQHEAIIEPELWQAVPSAFQKSAARLAGAVEAPRICARLTPYQSHYNAPGPARPTPCRMVSSSRPDGAIRTVDALGCSAPYRTPTVRRSCPLQP